MRSFLTEFFAFLGSPQLGSPCDSVRRRWARFATMLVFVIVCNLPLAILVAWVFEWSGARHLVGEEFTWLLVLFAVVVAPVVEEAAFRLPLAEFRVWRMVPLALTGVVLTIGHPVLVVAVIPALVVVLLWIRRHVSSDTAETMWRQQFPAIFHGFALIFALYHGFNFDLGSGRIAALWVWPILVLPQYVVGLVLGFIRVRNGLLESILMHCLYNAIVLLPAFTG